MRLARSFTFRWFIQLVGASALVGGVIGWLTYDDDQHIERDLLNPHLPNLVGPAI